VNHGLANILTQLNQSSASKRKRPISRLAFLQQQESLQERLVLLRLVLLRQRELVLLRQRVLVLLRQRVLALQRQVLALQRQVLALRPVPESLRPVFRQRRLRSTRGFHLWRSGSIRPFQPEHRSKRLGSQQAGNRLKRSKHRPQPTNGKTFAWIFSRNES